MDAAGGVEWKGAGRGGEGGVHHDSKHRESRIELGGVFFSIRKIIIVYLQMRTAENGPGAL